MQSSQVQIQVGDDRLAGTLAVPSATLPGVLFVRGWGGSQEQDLNCAQEIAALGCVCLTFDLRGHAATKARRQEVTLAQNYADVLAAFDLLAAQPAVDRSAIAVIGSSYGGYLGALLTAERSVRWLALRVPALYRDSGWSKAKAALDRADLQRLRRMVLTPENNKALQACATFAGDALIVESEQDDYVPHSTVANYVSAMRQARSITYRVIAGADHALSDPACQRAYDALLVRWTTEMVLGAR